MNALIMNVDGTSSLVPFDGSYSTVLALLSAAGTDAVVLDGLVAYVRSDSRENAPVNVEATRTIERLAPGFATENTLCGPVLFVAVDDDGDPVDVAAAAALLDA